MEKPPSYLMLSRVRAVRGFKQRQYSKDNEPNQINPAKYNTILLSNNQSQRNLSLLLVAIMASYCDHHWLLQKTQRLTEVYQEA